MREKIRQKMENLQIGKYMQIFNLFGYRQPSRRKIFDDSSLLIKINIRTIIIKLMNHESKVLDEILINRTFT